MRRFSLAAVTFGVPFLFSGCWVQSLQPFHTAEAAVKMPELDGSWKLVRQSDRDVSDENIRPWVFGGKVTAFDRSNVEGTIGFTIFKAGDHVYLDVKAEEPARDGSVNLFWRCLARPVHSLVRVELKDDTLALLPLSYEWLLVKKGEPGEVSLPTLKCEELKGLPALLFNASPEQWEQFLKKHGGDEGAFPRKTALVLKRAAAAPPPATPP